MKMTELDFFIQGWKQRKCTYRKSTDSWRWYKRTDIHL